MTQSNLIRIVVLAGLIGLSGCSKSDTPPVAATASSGTSTPSTDASLSGSQGAAGSPSAAETAAAPKLIVVHSGTTIAVTVDQPVSSKTSNPGDRFEASLAAPVRVGSKMVIPSGARVIGKVTDAKSAGKFNGHAELTLTLVSVRVGGERHSVKTTSVTHAGKSRGARTGIGAGGGAVIGGIVGAIAGGGKGAAVGVGAGAGAGAAGAGFTGDRDVEIPVETKLSFTLTEPLRIDEK